MKLALLLPLALAAFSSAAPNTKPPTVALYYESLCPGCHEFITGQLAPTYSTLGDLINVQLVPYGNAEEVDGQIQCQHGPEECYGNAVQACLLAANGGDAKQSLTFITCMIEQPNADDTQTAAKKCATDLGLDWSALNTCATGPKGAALIAANKKKTDALNPPHQYVPWIVIDGVHTEPLQDRAQTALLKLLCKNYLAKDVPQCKNADKQEGGTVDKCFKGL